MKKLVGFLLILNLLFSCSIEPSKIEYGKDACHYCKMTIVEETHAAQIVTKKGKPYKYDAIECLLNDLENREEKDIALFLVTDYLTPKKLIDAKTATYLISENIQSPMGANLTAFTQKENAEKYVTNGTDKIFNWVELQNHFFN
ncbi:MAG: nitrous oxide reductase accessory protein NosL [Aureibaculum sp.]|nr:nitrous oxide reductase accessory protein NosL [Aureibaculum sp.]